MNLLPISDKSIAGVRFRIQLKESEKLQMVGPCDLVVSEDSIVLYSVNSGELDFLCA